MKRQFLHGGHCQPPNEASAAAAAKPWSRPAAAAAVANRIRFEGEEQRLEEVAILLPEPGLVWQPCKRSVARTHVLTRHAQLLLCSSARRLLLPRDLQDIYRLLNSDGLEKNRAPGDRSTTDLVRHPTQSCAVRAPLR